ncbi:DUF6274 family protein [Streptomyces sp. NPDC056930]|uniref:DUF6274 family protein n=1 Tax=Streptomyces sp. NPDC056930 TaxID=3345967 RepID=UPI003644C24F
MTASAGHETRALLRAHLAAASGYRHLTRHCPICHRLLRLAMEPVAASRTASLPRAAGPVREAPGRHPGRPGGPGRKSLARVTNGAAFRFLKVAGSYLARLMQCDGSHRMSFEKG